MADIAGMLIQSTLQQAGEAPDFVGAISKGAALAGQIEETRMRRQQLEQQKAESQTQKWTLVGNMYDRWEKMPDGAAKNNIGQKVIPAMLNTFGLSQEMNPAVAEMMAKDPTIGAFFTSKVRTGDIDFAKLTEAMKDTDSFSKFLVENNYATYADEKLLGLTRSTLQNSLGDLKKASEDKISSNEQDKRKEMEIIAAMEKQRQGQEAAPDVDLRKKIGERYEIWKSGGGLAARQKAEKIFENAIERLKKGEVKLGTSGGTVSGAIKQVPWVGNPENIPAIDPKAAELIADIRGGISVKEKTGDPNPATTQIDQIMMRAIDHRLSNEANIKKLQTELDAMRADTKEKVETFKQYGLINDGPKPFSVSPEQKKQFKALSPDMQKKAIKGLTQQFGITEGEARKALSGGK